MPDVGILQLQIHDNSEKAAQGLQHLSGALTAVKNAVSGGLRLSPVAKQIENIGKVVSANISNDTISRVNQLADAISRLKAASEGLDMSGLRGIGGTRGRSDGNATAIAEGVRDAVREAENAFVNVDSRVEETVGATEEFNGVLGETNTLIQSMAWQAGGAAETLKDALDMWVRFRSSNSLGNGGSNALPEGVIYTEGTVTAAEDMKSLNGQVADSLESVTQEATEATEAVREYNDAMEASSSFWDNRGDGRYTRAGTPGLFHQYEAPINEIPGERAGMDYVDDLLQNASDIDLVGMKMEYLRDKMIEGADSGKMNASQIADTVMQYRKLEEQLDSLNGSVETQSFADKAKEELGSLRDSIESLFPGLNNLARSFMRIAKYRMIRAAIKEITDGFKTGVENVYQYSKAIGGSFAPSMDSAASVLLKMKNAIGAAVAPVLQALIPYLQIVVNWFITAVNYANQFFALLRGQTAWTHAIDTQANAFDDVTTSATGASAAVKDLLADWDELNIIQSDGGGSGGPTGPDAMTDYLDMFEEVNTFDRRIRDIVNFLKDNLKDILNIAKAVGAALLAWKISSAVEGILSKVLGGIVISALEFSLVYDGVKSLITDGFSVGALVESVIGFLIGTVGLWKITGSLSAGLGIATVVAVAATLTAFHVARMESYAEMAKNAFRNSGEDGLDPAELLEAVQQEFDRITKGNELVINAYANAESIKANLHGLLGEIDSLNSVMFGAEAPTDEQVQQFLGTWGQVFDALGQEHETDFSTIFAGLTNAFNSADADIRERAESIRTSMLMVQEGISQAEAELRTETEGLASKIAKGSASEDEIEQYFNNLAIIADSQNTAYRALQNMQEGVGNIDFGDIDGALDFISGIGTKAQEAADESKQAAQAAIDAATNELNMLESMYQHGRIGADVYNDYKTSLEEFIGLMNDNAGKDIEEITSSASGMYQRVLDQAMDTLLNGEEYQGADREQIQSYVDTIIRPIIDEMLKYPDTMDEGQLKRLKELPNTLINLAEESTEFARYGGGYGVGLGALFDWAFGTDFVTRTSEDWREKLNEAYGNVFSSADVPSGGVKTMSSRLRDRALEAADDAVASLEGDQSAKNGLKEWWDSLLYIEPGEADLVGEFKPLDEQVGEAVKPIGDWFSRIGQGIADFFLAEPSELDWFTGIPQGINDFLYIEPGELDYEIDTGDLEGASLPAVDNSEFVNSMVEAANATEESVRRILEALAALDGTGVGFSGGFRTSANVNEVAQRASGGFVRSGDLVMANENGNFEMMGRMGNQPVVANNNQIIDGITSGVAEGNGQLDSRMSNIETLLNRILQKEFVAKAVPDSKWGNHAARSAEQYSRVTG